MRIVYFIIISTFTFKISKNQGLTNSLNNFAPSYSSSSTYAVDSLVTYNGKFYKCIVAVTSPEQFDINKWDDVTTSEVYARTDNSHYYRVLSYNNKKSVPADTTKTHSQFIDASLASILSSLTSELTSNQKAIIKSIGYNFTTFVMENNNIISHNSSSYGNIQACSIADDGSFMRLELITKWGNSSSDMVMTSIKHSDGTVTYENISSSTASNHEFNVTYDVVEYV